MYLKDKTPTGDTLFSFGHYPYRLKRISKERYPFGHDVLLGIGGNIGDVPRRFEHLYTFLVKSPFVTVVETSPILKNPPFGYLEQEDFYNAVIHIRTPLMPGKLLVYILRIEKYFGRKRKFQDGPRTLDIDMIFYENREMETKRLILPHPRYRERDSVMVPLREMKGVAWLKRHL